jgi:hypothetical protein
MNGARLVLFLAIVLAMAGIVQASVHVGGWSLSANGQLARDFQYTGPCPVDLKFDWSVVGTEPGKVTYTILRSDGGRSFKPQAIDLPAADRPVSITDEWRWGTNTSPSAHASGWIQLDIQSPNPVSKKINFNIHCAGTKAADANVSVGGGALTVNGELVKSFKYTGPCPVDLKFDWGLISTAPTTATYSVEHNDGSQSSSSRSVVLPQANQSVSVFDNWHLGANTSQFANYNGWVELNVESPNTASQRINFTVHCKE